MINIEENQKELVPTLQYFADVRKDFKATSKFLSVILVISLIINLVVVGLFLNVVTTQSRDFMEFMNSTDFEVIIEQRNTIYDNAGAIDNKVNQSN